HDGGIGVELLLPVRLSAPRRRIALRRHEVFHAVRDAVQRTPHLACLDFTIPLRRLGHGPLARDRDDGVVARTDPLEAIEKVGRQLRRRGLFLPDQPTELDNREKCKVCHQSAPRYTEYTKSGSSALVTVV